LLQRLTYWGGGCDVLIDERGEGEWGDEGKSLSLQGVRSPAPCQLESHE
jgi:hypothetical protein